MTRVITLQLLVRDDDEVRIEEGLREMFTVAQTPVDAEDEDLRPWLASWSIKRIEAVNEVVAAELAGGAAARRSILDGEFVICFAGARAEEAFYSSTYGPTSLDLATKFSAASVRDALGVTEQGWLEWCNKNRAYVTRAPYGLARYTAQIRMSNPQGEDAEALEHHKLVEVWATDAEAARVSLEVIHGRGNIVSVRAE